MSDEDRRNYANLLLLCYAHHVETNDVDTYGADSLYKMKVEHESRFEKDDFRINETALRKIVADMSRYWEEIERLNTADHSHQSLSFRINAQGDYNEIFQSIHTCLNEIEALHRVLRDSDDSLQADFECLLAKREIDPLLFTDIPYYQHPFQIRNWETHNLGFPNWLQRARIDLAHIELKYLEEYLKIHNNDALARDRLARLKQEFAELAQHAIHID